MAGSAHFQAKTSGRKQWNSLEDSVRGCLLRSGIQQAENGCLESQVLLAKELLNHPWDKEGNAWSNKDARQAVYWLIKASEQGSKEATEILQKCLVTGQGITEVNILDVKRCLNMTERDKAARRSAQKIFNRLSAGDDFITTEQLRRAMFDRLCYEEGSSDADSEDHSIGEKLTEDHIVNAAVEYSRGEVPFVHRLLKVVPVVPNRPPQVLTQGYDMLINILGRRRLSFAPGSQTATTLQIFAVLALYTIWESLDVYALFPPILYYCSLTAMVIFTAQMLQTKRDFRHFTCWSGLFWKNDYYLRNIQEAEHQFYRNNIHPYGNFFVALVINLVTYPLVAEKWVPHAQLAVLAFSFTFLTLYAFLGINQRNQFMMAIFMSSFSTALHLLSFAVNVLAVTMDTLVAQAFRYFDWRLPTFPPYTVGNGVELCLSFRAVFHLMMPILLLRMAVADGWRGTYEIMIPHCITLAWWQIAILAARSSSWFALARSAAALASSVLLLPIAGLSSLSVGLVAGVRYFATESPLVAQVVVSTALASISLLGILYIQGRGASRQSFRAKLAKFASWLKLVLIVSVAVLWITPVFIAKDDAEFHDIHSSENPGGMQLNPNHAMSTLTWEQYHSNCNHPAWDNGNEAQTQLLCSQLEGVPVKWDGYVHSVRITRIRNPWRELVRRLPNNLGNALACVVSFFTEKGSLDPCALETNRSPSEEQRCRRILDWARQSQSNKCSLVEWNRYNFEVDVRMKLGLWSSNAVPIVLHAEDYFRNWTNALRAGDHIWFSGILTNGPAWNTNSNNVLGGSHPQVSLANAGCLECRLNPEAVTQGFSDGVSFRDIVNFISLGTKSVLNFVFNPVVIFK